MSILTINSVAIKDPQVLQWDISDLDSEDGSGRNQLGQMFRDRVAVKRKLTCQWPPLDQSEISAILTAVSGEFFTITYPDAQTGAFRTMTAYVGDRSAPMYMFQGNDKWLWENLSMNIIEQ